MSNQLECEFKIIYQFIKKKILSISVQKTACVRISVCIVSPIELQNVFNQVDNK